MHFDLRILLIVPTIGAIFFVAVGYGTGGEQGLHDNYVNLSDHIGLYIVLAIAYILAICLAYRYLAQRPKRYVTYRM